MNLAEVFIRRPVMTTLVMLGILLFGVVSYRSLPVNDLPNVDFPTIMVTAYLPGAGPETMASAVATPLEKEFSTIAGLDSMTSINGQGVTQITLQFVLERNLDAAAQDVQSAITKASRQLPPDMATPPWLRKVNPADQPILYLNLRSPILPLHVLDEYAQTLLAQRISMISGVAQVTVYGSQKYAVRIQLNPKAMASRGIGIDEVAAAVRNSNVNLPTGSLSGPYQTYTIESTGRLYRAEAFRPVIVAYRQGAPVRLDQIGRVLDSVENNKVASWYIHERSIGMAIQRQPGTNTIEVVDRIKQLIPSLKEQLPASAELVVLLDRSESIRASVNEVKFTLILAVVLVVLVIFFFLRNLSATVIPSLALPMSLVATFAVMYFQGFSINNLTLMALILCVGFVVDDAIVMLENIVRHMEKGEGPFAASLNGSREISFTILSMTLSLAAVFIPVLFMGGILGRLFREFAVTIIAAILVSGFVSLSLTPMLCSRFLRPPQTLRHSRMYWASERFFNGMLRLYDLSLRKVLEHPRTTMVVTGLTLAATVYLFIVSPKGFLPSEDTGQIMAFTEAAQGISFENMVRHQQVVAEIIRRDPNVESFTSTAGVGGLSATANTGRLFIRLKPRSERKLSADEVIQSLRSKLAGVPGIQVFLQNPPPIRIGGRITKGDYQYTLQSPNTEELYRAASHLESRLRALPLLQDVSSDMQLKNPLIRVEIDRNKAATLGVSVAQIEDALYSAYGSRQISTIYAPNNQYQVILELEPEYQTDPSALSLLYIRSRDNRPVPLATVARLSRDIGPMVVNHSGQHPSVTLSFNLRPGAALGDAVAAVEKTAQAVLPSSVTGSFQGSAQAFQDSLRGLWLLLFLAVLVIYIVLGILYESFIHPLTILSGLPSAAFGALLTLWIFEIELSIYAFVGIIMLIGIVKKNAIMMIDFALEAQRTEGKPSAEAIYQGCLIRFRPIMMTTMAALMGTLPIALGFGAGAESRRPLGLAVVGGLVFSQLLTLYITPVFYLYMEKFLEKFRRLSKRKPLAASERGSVPAA